MFRRNVRWTFRRDTYAIDVPGFQGAEPSGKFRNSPKAGSGAEWLATLRNLPVISPPLNRHVPSHIFHPTLSDQNGDDSGLVVQELTVEEKEKLPFHRFSLSETGCSCITPIRSIGQSYAVSSTLSLFFALLVQSTHLPTLFCYIFLLFLSFFFWISFHFC